MYRWVVPSGFMFITVTIQTLWIAYAHSLASNYDGLERLPD